MIPSWYNRYINEVNIMTTGERIRLLRKQYGISADMLAEKLGVSRATMFRYENGDVEKLPGSLLEPLAKALHTTPASLMGWDENDTDVSEDDTVEIPIVAEVAHYNALAGMNAFEETVRVDSSLIKGRKPSDFCAMRVKGDSMLPKFEDGDIVVLLLQSTMNRSGQIGVVSYGDEEMTIKRIHYVQGEDWMELEPLNNRYPTKRITGYELECCHIVGIPKLLIRQYE